MDAPAPKQMCKKCGQVHERCTAHRRRKKGSKDPLQPCGKYKAPGMKVCGLHGGKSLKGTAHPRYVNGNRSSYSYLPDLKVKRIEEMAYDEIENLVEAAKIQRALETEVLERFGTGESGEAWKLLQKAVNDHKAAHEATPEFDLIARIVLEGQEDGALRREIFILHENQRKLTESIVKCRSTVQETYTREMWNEMLSEIMLIHKQEIHDRDTLQRLQNAFAIRSLDAEAAASRGLLIPGNGAKHE